MFGWIMNVNEINDEYVEVWITYFEAFWLFNVVGEAIPQLIIRLIFPFHEILLKSSQNKKDLNDVTAAPFSVFFLLLAAEENTPKTGQL